MAWNIFEATAMTPDERVDWSAAALMLRSKIAGDPRFNDTSVSKMGRSRATYPGWLPKDGDGPVYLGSEVVKMGGKVPANVDKDRVYWKNAKGGFSAIGRDWSDWKKRITEALKTYGIGDPRADENARAWATAIAIASAAAGVVLLATGVGAPVAAAVVAAGSTASGVLLSEADKAEAAFSSDAAATGQKLNYTGSDATRGVIDASANLVSSIADVADSATSTSGEVDVSGLANAAAGLYSAATGTGTTTAPPATAPATVPATTETAFVTWAKSPTGMIILGVGALFLVYKIAGRR